ncbi:MAG: SMP-30/gluconolactonase/LRE family protein [Candidatus Sphingomonas colombiensis]|nr:SMP-30/gluconolactonase/LRE family protein [Sphingomonas sp.]WEK44065.1 MAG: SMP-30/gluconolactonase/LRE family protein [Sphingomonas sp.]
MTDVALEMQVIAEGLQFPEGPIAMADGSVLVVEIKRGTLTRVGADGVATVIAELGGGPNGAALGPDGAVYVCNNGGFTWHEIAGALIPDGTPDDYAGGSIQRVDLTTGAVSTLYAACDGRPLRGPNDLVFDGHGGFWFTDHGKADAERSDHGAIFHARADGSKITRVLDRLHGPNGIGLSPDGGTLYWAETPTSRLWSRRVVGPGELAPSVNPLAPGELVHAMPDYRLFDSLKVEADGRVCVGTLVQGGITIAGGGSDFEFVTFPEVAITNLAFGGADLRDVWATASSSGRLYKLRWPRAGLRLAHQ